MFLSFKNNLTLIDNIVRKLFITLIITSRSPFRVKIKNFIFKGGKYSWQREEA